MAKKSAGKLAGLAALGAAAYMINEKFGKGKDAKGPSATADEEKSSKARTAAQREAVSGNRATDESAYTGTTKNNSNAAKNIGFGGGDDSDKNLRRVEPAPVDKRGVVKDNKLAQVDEVDKNENYSNEGRNKPEIKTEDKPLYKQEGVTIGGVEKRTEGNKPMPSLKKVEEKAAARKASISTDEMKNRSRRINPKTAPFRKANIDQIPGQNRSGPTGGERVSGTELSRNLSNTAVALSPLTGGTSKVAAEFAMGRNAAKALQGEGKLSAAGQRLKNMEEVRNVAMPGRNATVTNPNAWAAGPKGMDKIAQAEARAAAAEARAAAAEAKRNSKDPFMSFKPGSDFKRGGMTKMASGGMTASRRGDGIASRGKTKCKMY